MEDKAGKIANQTKKEQQELMQRIRKQRIEKILMQKRLTRPTNETQAQPNETMELEEREDKEAAEKIGNLNLCQHRRRFKRSKKRCWHCRSFGHFKESCPHIRCFWCHKLGHTKSKCFFRISMELYKRLELIENKKEHKKKIKRKKEKEHRESIQIYKQRLLTSNFVKHDGNWKLECENKIIGDYLGINEPINLEDLRRTTIKWKYVDKKIIRDTPLASVPLRDGFENLCGCGKYLNKKNFISHLWEKHQGKVPSNSHINQPPWIWNILFESDELEMLYCRSNERLSEII